MEKMIKSRRLPKNKQGGNHEYCHPYRKINHQPYENMLNLRDGKYQYDVQQIAMQLASDITCDKSADMLNEIYRFGIASTIQLAAGGFVFPDSLFGAGRGWRKG